MLIQHYSFANMPDGLEWSSGRKRVYDWIVDLCGHLCLSTGEISTWPCGMSLYEHVYNIDERMQVALPSFASFRIDRAYERRYHILKRSAKPNARALPPLRSASKDWFVVSRLQEKIHSLFIYSLPPIPFAACKYLSMQRGQPWPSPAWRYWGRTNNQSLSSLELS